jgi:hypothetical protein
MESTIIIINTIGITIIVHRHRHHLLQEILSVKLEVA